MRRLFPAQQGPARRRVAAALGTSAGLLALGLTALAAAPAVAVTAPTWSGSLGGGSSAWWQAEQVVVTLPSSVASLRVEVHVKKTAGTAFTDQWSTLPTANSSTTTGSEVVCTYVMTSVVTAGQQSFSCNHQTGGNAHDWTADTVLLTTTGPSATASGPLQAPPPPPPPTSTTPPVVRVSGNHLVDGSGAELQLRGVNRSGTEYACIQGWGMFDGPTDDASVAAIASWGTNVVRLPLNEDCWLGINGVNPAYGGSSYQAAVRGFVQTLHRHGLAVILDLQLAEPGTTPATGTLEPMPDADHAPTFWAQVAAAYAADPSIVFDLFNEPHDVSWSCWRNGCTLPAGWRAAGMQSLVNAVRSTGAGQPIIAGGLSYSNDMSGWLANAPADPARQLAVSFHLYDTAGACNTASCWDAQVAPVAAVVPVLTGELGQTNCGESFVDAYMAWADAHGGSYLGWTWNTWSCTAGPALITDFNGTPTAYGVGIRNHMRTVAAARAPAAVAPSAGPYSNPYWLAEQAVVDLRAAASSLTFEVHVARTPGLSPTDAWSSLPSGARVSQTVLAAEVVCSYSSAGGVPAATYTFSCNSSIAGNHPMAPDTWVLKTAGPAADLTGAMG